MKFQTLAVLGLLIAGCSNNAPSGQSATSGPPVTAQTTPGATAIGSPPAKTPEELVANYKAAFAAADKAAIDKMIHWEGASENTQAFIKKLFYPDREAGEATITEEKLRVPDPTEYAEGQLLPVTHTFAFTKQTKDGPNPGSKGLPITKFENHYYFYCFAPPKAN